MRKELQSLLEKGAVVLVTNSQKVSTPSFPWFPRKTVKCDHAVINLKQLNQWVSVEHFKMERISTLWDLLRPRD